MSLEDFNVTNRYKFEKVIVVPFTYEEYSAEYVNLRKIPKATIFKLLKVVEKRSKEGGMGFDSLGPLMQGFSIDPVTLATLRTTEHNNVRGLAEQILSAHGTPNSENLTSGENISNLNKRIINGFVYLRLPGIKIPVVKLFVKNSLKMGTTPEDIKRAVEHIKVSKELLPINEDCEVF
jgi:hypothetical protein